MSRLMLVLVMLWDRPGYRWALVAVLTGLALIFDSIWWA